MGDEPREFWDGRFVKRLKRAAIEGEIARVISWAVGLVIIFMFVAASMDFLWESVRPPRLD